MIIKILVVIVTASFLSGCIPTVSLNQDQPSGGSMEFTKGKVVAGFPSLPLYPKAQVVESFGYKGSYGASFVSKDQLGKVIKFYSEALPQLGWEASLKKNSETNYFFEVKNAENLGTIIINTVSDDKRTAISMSISRR